MDEIPFARTAREARIGTGTEDKSTETQNVITDHLHGQ
jgi:hypothetical protein